MAVPADRISGAFFLLLGLAMYFLVNPRFIESVDGGNIAPDALPNVVSIIIAVCGALLLAKPVPQQSLDVESMARAGLYVLVLAAGIYAMSWFGFEFVAPVMAFFIMWMIGERRAMWLVAGAIGMPALIWFLVIHALGRALP
ncbi:MAG: tripartite tricarboxylate transporter TctB family protein [Granulosicoccus sp.]